MKDVNGTKNALQQIFDSWSASSKNLWKLIDYGMSSTVKIGLGYGTTINAETSKPVKALGPKRNNLFLIVQDHPLKHMEHRALKTRISILGLERFVPCIGLELPCIDPTLPVFRVFHLGFLGSEYRGDDELVIEGFRLWGVVEFSGGWGAGVWGRQREVGARVLLVYIRAWGLLVGPRLWDARPAGRPHPRLLLLREFNISRDQSL
ncbi:hypothetical protein Tco_0888983 [Tanacetum coccineum]